MTEYLDDKTNLTYTQAIDTIKDSGLNPQSWIDDGRNIFSLAKAILDEKKKKETRGKNEQSKS